MRFVSVSCPCVPFGIGQSSTVAFLLSVGSAADGCRAASCACPDGKKQKRSEQ